MNPEDRPRRGRDVPQFLSKHGIRGVYSMKYEGFSCLECEPTANWRSREVEVFFLNELTCNQWLKTFKAINENPTNSSSAISRPTMLESIRRECLDHVIVFGEEHLRRVLTEYFDYYNHSRTHLSLDQNSPIPRPVDPPENGRVVATSFLGGLHHRYSRVA